MAAFSYTYTLTNGTTADADEVMQNFNDVRNSLTDGTKDVSIAALTAAGTATFNGAVNLGNSTADDITWTGSLASSIPIKTTNSYDIGSSTRGIRALYFGANSKTTKIQGASSMAADWTLTLPPNVGTKGYALVDSDGSGTGAWANVSPVGTISAYGGASAPTGWLLCDGSAVSRTTYAGLFAVIGESFGEGDGVTTFHLPDLRGRFLRGVDGGTGVDPDASGRTALNTGGNTGDAVGSLQEDELESHTHDIVVNGSGASQAVTAKSGGASFGSSTAAAIVAEGGSETRPTNVYVNFIIKT